MLAHADTVGYVQINQYWYKYVYNLLNITEDLTIITVILVSYSGNFSSYFNSNYTFSPYVDYLPKSHINFMNYIYLGFPQFNAAINLIYFSL